MRLESSLPLQCCIALRSVEVQADPWLADGDRTDETAAATLRGLEKGPNQQGILYPLQQSPNQGNGTTGMPARKNAHVNLACFIFSDTLLVDE